MEISRDFRVKLQESLTPLIDSKTQLLRAPSLGDGDSSSTDYAVSTHFLYALHLLRSKEREMMKRAFELIDQLTYFQSPLESSKGNFVVYMHQFPHVERQFESIDCLMSIFWILNDFSTVIDKKLKERLLSCACLSLKVLKQKIHEKKYSYLLSLQAACVLDAFSDTFVDLSLNSASESLLNTLSEVLFDPSWGCPRDQIKILIALSLLKNNQLKKFEHFFRYMNQVWQKEQISYLGPSYGESFIKGQPKVEAIHLLISEIKGEIGNDFPPLMALLVHLSSSEVRKKLALSAELVSQKTPNYEVIHHSRSCLAFFNLPLEHWVKTGGYYPLKVLGQKVEGKLDQFVLQMGCPVKIEVLSDRELNLHFDTQGELEPEIYFFWNRAKHMQATVEEKKCTLFKGNQTFSLTSPCFKLEIKAITHSDVTWGQIMFCNRKYKVDAPLVDLQDQHLYYRFIKPLSSLFTLNLQIYDQ